MKKQLYTIIIEILKEQHEATGETIDEALQGFQLDWTNIKGKGIVTITYGSARHEHLLSMKVLRRIFSNKIVRMHWAKNFELLLKESNNITKLHDGPTEGDDVEAISKNAVPTRRGRKAKGTA